MIDFGWWHLNDITWYKNIVTGSLRPAERNQVWSMCFCCWLSGRFRLRFVVQNPKLVWAPRKLAKARKHFAVPKTAETNSGMFGTFSTCFFDFIFFLFYCIHNIFCSAKQATNVKSLDLSHTISWQPLFAWPGIFRFAMQWLVIAWPRLICPPVPGHRISTGPHLKRFSALCQRCICWGMAKRSQERGPFREAKSEAYL